MFLEFFSQCRWSALDDVAGDICIQHEPRHRGSRDCGDESLRFSRKSSGTSTCIAKNDDQLGLTGEINNPSPCFRIRTSLTSAGKRNSCGSRTAWLAPLRNMDAPLATALDIDLAAAFDVAAAFEVADLLFPVRARALHWRRRPPGPGIAQRPPRMPKGFALFVLSMVVLGNTVASVFTYAAMRL